MIKKAKISEIFRSIQGEGLYFGVPQIFIRFYDCNLQCDFCDTRLKSFKDYTIKGLLTAVSKYAKPCHSLSLTGGEPLLQADFLESFLPEYKKTCKRPVYLETNGTLSGALERVIDWVDIIAMDFKLSSSTGRESFWEEHERFLRTCRWKKVFVKVVITPNTGSAEIAALCHMVEETDKKIPVVLQPVTTKKENHKVEREDLEHYRSLLTDRLKRVEIIPQVHKLLGMK